MPKYHFTYASTTPMPDDREVVAEIMQAWEAWFAQLGPDVIDPGAMLAPGSTVTADGVSHGGSAANGYSVVAAEDLDDALSKARACPVLHGGGTVEVHELVNQ